MRNWRQPRSAYLVGFCIKEEERQQGLGRFFLEQIIDRIEQEISLIELTVAPTNQAALGLYRRAGFEEVGYLKDAYGAGRDRLLLRLKLVE